MPYPDNFSSTRFAARYGDEAYDQQVADAEGHVAHDVADAKKLRDAAKAFLAAIDGIEFQPLFGGYEIDDLRPIVEAAAAIDLVALEARLVADAMEVV